MIAVINTSISYFEASANLPLTDYNFLKDEWIYACLYTHPRSLLLEGPFETALLCIQNIKFAEGPWL